MSNGYAKEWIEYHIMSESSTVYDDAMQAIEENQFEAADAFREMLRHGKRLMVLKAKFSKSTFRSLSFVTMQCY